MVRMSKESLRCLAVYLVKLKPQVKVLEATHLSNRTQYSCTLSVIITHPRVIKSTLSSTIEPYAPACVKHPHRHLQLRLIVEYT